MDITRKIAVAVTVPAALALTAAGAYAAASPSSPIDSSGVIHGCYSTRASHGSHAVVLQNAGTGCPRGSTAITWNQKGATGSGGTVTAGPAGLDVAVYKSDVVSADALQVMCPSSHPYAMGGGGAVLDQTDSVPLIADEPVYVTGQTTPLGWFIQPANQVHVHLRVYVICAK